MKVLCTGRSSDTGSTEFVLLLFFIGIKYNVNVGSFKWVEEYNKRIRTIIGTTKETVFTPEKRLMRYVRDGFPIIFPRTRKN